MSENIVKLSVRRRLFSNPVFTRETRTSFRSYKMFMAIMTYSLVITIAAGVTVYGITQQENYGFNPQEMMYLYVVLTAFQNFLVALIVPTLTGGAISAERERQTLDLMIISKMSTFSIIMGKLAASIMIIFMMVISSIPAYGIILYFSGISLWNLLSMTMFSLLFSGFIGSVAIFFSTVTKKTILAIIFTYIVLLLITIASLVFYLTYNSSLQGGNVMTQVVKAIFLSFNPMVAYASLMDSQIGIGLIGLLEEMSNGYYYSSMDIPSITEILILPIWVINGIIGLILSAILIFASAFIIQPAKTRR